MGRPPKGQTVAERIFSQVDFTGICWEWQGYILNPGVPGRGHGRTHAEGKRVLVHRWVWEHLVGPIPGGLEIDHLCRNNACCNPDHLQPVPHRINTLRGSAPSARHAEKTHCHKGHEFTPENTKRGARGERVCRTCNSVWQKRYRERLAAR